MIWREKKNLYQIKKRIFSCYPTLVFVIREMSINIVHSSSSLDKLISKIVLCCLCEESIDAGSEVTSCCFLSGSKCTFCPAYSNWFLNLSGGKDAQWVFEGRPLQSPADFILRVQEVNGKLLVITLHLRKEKLACGVLLYTVIESFWSQTDVQIFGRKWKCI